MLKFRQPPGFALCRFLYFVKGSSCEVCYSVGGVCVGVVSACVIFVVCVVVCEWCDVKFVSVVCMYIVFVGFSSVEGI